MAFERLAAHRVAIRCDDANTRSQRVAKRCGFEIEGVLRQHALDMAGRPRDTRLSRVRRDA